MIEFLAVFAELHQLRQRVPELTAALAKEEHDHFQTVLAFGDALHALESPSMARLVAAGARFVAFKTKVGDDEPGRCICGRGPGGPEWGGPGSCIHCNRVVPDLDEALDVIVREREQKASHASLKAMLDNPRSFRPLELFDPQVSTLPKPWVEMGWTTDGANIRTPDGRIAIQAFSDGSWAAYVDHGREVADLCRPGTVPEGPHRVHRAQLMAWNAVARASQHGLTPACMVPHPDALDVERIITAAFNAECPPGVALPSTRSWVAKAIAAGITELDRQRRGGA